MNTTEAMKQKTIRTRQTKIGSFLQSVPDTFCLDLVKLTVCCRYTESLLANRVIKRYLEKYHSQQLDEMEELVAEINSAEIGTGK